MLCRGGFDRRVPGREPRADEHAAALEAPLLLRSRHRGGDRAPGADPGRHGAPLPAPPLGHRGGALSLTLARAGPQGRIEEHPRQDQGRAAVPGAGDAHRARCCEVLRRGGERAAQGHGDLPPPRHHRAPGREDGHAHGRARLRGGVRAALLQPDQGLRRIWLSREPCGELRPPRLRVGVDQVSPSGGVRGGALELAADGLLRAGADRARCARARG